MKILYQVKYYQYKMVRNISLADKNLAIHILEKFFIKKTKKINKILGIQ